MLGNRPGTGKWGDSIRESDALEARQYNSEWVGWECRVIKLDWRIIHDLVRCLECQEEVMFSQEVMASEVSQFELTQFTIWL